MHSSRMCTIRCSDCRGVSAWGSALGGVCPGECLPRGCLPGWCLPRGVYPGGSPQGECLPRGYLPWGVSTRGVSAWVVSAPVHAGIHTAPCEQNHRFLQKHNLATTTLRTVIMTLQITNLHNISKLYIYNFEMN